MIIKLFKSLLFKIKSKYIRLFKNIDLKPLFNLNINLKFAINLIIKLILKIIFKSVKNILYQFKKENNQIIYYHQNKQIFR